MGGAVERGDEQQPELPGSCECVVAVELLGPVHELDGHVGSPTRARRWPWRWRSASEVILQPGVLPGACAGVQPVTRRWGGPRSGTRCVTGDGWRYVTEPRRRGDRRACAARVVAPGSTASARDCSRSRGAGSTRSARSPGASREPGAVAALRSGPTAVPAAATGPVPIADPPTPRDEASANRSSAVRRSRRVRRSPEEHLAFRPSAAPVQVLASLLPAHVACVTEPATPRRGDTAAR